jgi:hypothetical protein
VDRSALGEIAGYGREVSHHAFYWGAKLMLITTADGAVVAFGLAHPKELDERKQALHLLHVQPIAPTACPIVCDKGFAGAGIQTATTLLGHVLIRPRRDDEPPPAAGLGFLVGGVVCAVAAGAAVPGGGVRELLRH